MRLSPVLILKEGILTMGLVMYLHRKTSTAESKAVATGLQAAISFVTWGVKKHRQTLSQSRGFMRARHAVFLPPVFTRTIFVRWDSELRAGFYGWVLRCIKVCVRKQEPWFSVSSFLTCHLEEQDPSHQTPERIKKYTYPEKCLSLNSYLTPLGSDKGWGKKNGKLVK